MMTGAQRARFRWWRNANLASTWIAYAGFYFGRKAFYAVKDDLGFDNITLGHIGTAYLVSYALGQYLVAALGPRLGPRILLLVGMAISVASNVVFGFANGAWTFAAFMAVNGLAQASGWSACVGTLGNWTTRRERGTLMGFWSTCYQLGGVAATTWAGLWLMQAGWRGAFFAGAAVLMLAWVVVLLFQRNEPADCDLPAVVDDVELDADGAVVEQAQSGWTRQAVVTVALVGVAYFGIKLTRYAIWSWSPLLLRQVYGQAGDDAAYLSTVFDVGGFLGVIVAGIVSDRLFAGRRAQLSMYLLMGMVGANVMLYYAGPHSMIWFVSSMALIGFTLYGPDSLLSGAGAIEIGSRRTAVTAAAIINGTGQLGAVVQEQLVPRLYDESTGDLTPVFLMLVIAALTSLLAVGIVLWRNRRGLSDL